MKSIPRWLVAAAAPAPSIVLVSVLLLALPGAGASAVREFTAREPAPSTLDLPPVTRKVSPLDAAFLARVAELERDIAREPTTVANVRQRLPVLQAYYDALQGHGVLLNYAANMALNGIAPAQAHVRIWRLPMAAMENWNVRRPPLLPGEFERQASEVPGGQLLVDRTVALADLRSGSGVGEIEDGSTWSLSFAEPDLPRHRRVAVTLGPEHGVSSGRNHVYLRVKQLDDHTAWSSPTFIEFRP